MIKPALVGLTGPWISGGIEFNWPQHHRPTTYCPVDHKIIENEDGSKSLLTGAPFINLDYFGKHSSIFSVSLSISPSPMNSVTLVAGACILSYVSVTKSTASSTTSEIKSKKPPPFTLSFLILMNFYPSEGKPFGSFC